MSARKLSQTTRIDLVSRLKTMLPVASYLHLLHQGTMTGFLPRFDPQGKPTGQFDNLAPKDRIDLARYLLDKVLPDAPKELALVTAPPSSDEALDPKVLRHLTTDELRAIIAPPTGPEETPDVSTEITAAPTLTTPTAEPDPAPAGGEAGTPGASAA